jgi:hypothetical protein
VTSTFFEGQAEANPLAQRGYSRDHRPDCKQVCIALVVTFDGFPLGYEVFAGNTHDSRTLQTIVATMEARHGVLGRVWIGDRGMASAGNLAWLRQTGRRYIIGAPKAELKKFGAALAATAGWRHIREGVEVKLARDAETEETVILVRSAERRNKERAMHEKFSTRIADALARLAARIARGRRPIDPTQVNRQIGRILRQNQRAAARFAVRLEQDGGPAGFRLHVDCNPSFDDDLAPARRSGSSAPASATPRAPSSKNSRASNPTTSSCPPRRTARSACAASPSPTPPRPRSSIASASSCPSACA